MEDPYNLVKEEIQDSLKTLNTLFSSWNRLLKRIATISSEEFQKTTSEVLELVDTLEETCEDLSESVNLATQNPQKFGLTKNIVEERVNYIKKVRLGLEEVKNTVTDRELIEKAISNRNDSSYSINMENMDSSNTNNLELTDEQTQIILQNQDMELDSIFSTVNNLKSIASTINQELSDHQVLLDEMDTQLDDTTIKLKSAQKRLKVVLEKLGDVKSSVIITVLIVVLLLLVMLLIFT
ncbi:hypothetical protein CONCODRAFT_77113 [Conidiobolus coronatus NRRL 28638]|uniref:t-SNARE coiled-coil homology domain-containing protein n=1 Tax=Conidiobolus coronatus (strain ATCC 28846 / CBS 209.66 / NRRL 28638) TaxID=796925 RepID=A0A137PGB8_CONC2|nr:hypothetical protein CONCODRAFT_77113 [Conidiobolus coronatus NRRL 28638]|eukprot:KXN73981.1 hypothetical protein CONCODRAFT_77113 [Conidiobolus coronatus NRRL 28638]